MQEKVQHFIREHKAKNYLEAAQKEGFPIVYIQDLGLTSQIPGIGMVENLNRAILSTPEQDFSPLVEQDGSYYLAYVQRRSIRSERAWNASRQKVLEQALQAEQNRVVDEWYLAQKAMLEIIYPPAISR